MNRSISSKIQKLRYRLPLLRRAQVLGRIDRHPAFPQQKWIEVPESRQVAGDRTAAQAASGKMVEIAGADHPLRAAGPAGWTESLNLYKSAE